MFLNMPIPKIKKDLNSFLVGEEGKITKKSLIKTGSLLTAVALGSALAADQASAGMEHDNDITFNRQGEGVSASHSHHASHDSY